MKHLTDEQLAEWLAGENGEETRTHLQSCEPCHAEAIRLRDEVLRYSMAMRQQALRAQGSRMARYSAPSKAFARHHLRWAGAAVLGLLLAAQTAWMMKSRPVPQMFQPIASAPLNSQPNSQPAAQMSDDELLEAVNNDLSRDVPQALAPVSAITFARNKIAAASTGAGSTGNSSGK